MKDYVKGFGGKFGVQSDRQDKSAVGWDHQEKLQLHESQKGKRHHTLPWCCFDTLTMFCDMKWAKVSVVLKLFSCIVIARSGCTSFSDGLFILRWCSVIFDQKM